MTEPASRLHTIRESLLTALQKGEATARDLSAQVGIPEKDVAHHLEHLGKSLKARGLKLSVVPAACLSCGFVFQARQRLTRPGRCPACNQTHIEPPRFSVRAPPAQR